MVFIIGDTNTNTATIETERDREFRREVGKSDDDNGLRHVSNSEGDEIFCLTSTRAVNVATL